MKNNWYLGFMQSALEIFCIENIFSATVQSVINNNMISENLQQATVKLVILSLDIILL